MRDPKSFEFVGPITVSTLVDNEWKVIGIIADEMKGWTQVQRPDLDPPRQDFVPTEWVECVPEFHTERHVVSVFDHDPDERLPYDWARKNRPRTAFGLTPRGVSPFSALLDPHSTMTPERAKEMLDNFSKAFQTALQPFADAVNSITKSFQEITTANANAIANVGLAKSFGAALQPLADQMNARERAIWRIQSVTGWPAADVVKYVDEMVRTTTGSFDQVPYPKGYDMNLDATDLTVKEWKKYDFTFPGEGLPQPTVEAPRTRPAPKKVEKKSPRFERERKANRRRSRQA